MTLARSKALRNNATDSGGIYNQPEGVQKLVGDELQLIQFGGMPKDIKPFKGVGSGVFEIAIRFSNEAYRTVLAVQLGRKIYVLHAFQKKAKSGIKTPQFDVELIKQRYRVGRSWRNMTKRKEIKTKIEEGSGNVFADLGIAAADELFARAQIGFHVHQILESRELR
jgi:phage-related protein